MTDLHFRFENGQLWWRDHHSSLAEMSRVRASALADPAWAHFGMLRHRDEMIAQIDAAVKAFEAHEHA